MITARDKKIIAYLEEYKYATIEHLEKVFFKTQRNSYNIARRRMAEIIKAGYARRVRDVETNKVVYIFNNGESKQPSMHRLLVLDVLANLHHQGFNIEKFEIEKEWLNGKIRSDAFAVFTLEGAKNRYYYFVEVHISNNYCNLEKYDALYKTNEVQEYLGRNVYPRILLVTDRNFNYNTEHCKVIKLNTKLDEFASIILP